MLSFPEIESYTFGSDNKLKVFPQNTFKFKPKDHIVVDEIQQCILDNFWFQYNNKREDKGYFLAILNSLSEYFYSINGMMPSAESPEKIEKKALYILYNGKRPGIYTSFEEVVILKQELKYSKETPSFAKYMDIDEALAKARLHIGPNYFIEPAAKEYIQSYRLMNKKTSEVPVITKVKDPVGTKVKEEGSTSKKPTYKECLIKGVDPLDGEYIDWKLEEKFESIAPEWKKEIKKEILEELKKEIDDKFEEIKKSYDEKWTNSFLDEDMLDIAGHGQKPESESS